MVGNKRDVEGVIIFSNYTREKLGSLRSPHGQKNEALNYLKQYPKMDEYLHGCGSNKHKVSGADEREMNRT